jgi:hypothetical protein
LIRRQPSQAVIRSKSDDQHSDITFEYPPDALPAVA